MTNEENAADVRISNWTLATGTMPGARYVYSPTTMEYCFARRARSQGLVGASRRETRRLGGLAEHRSPTRPSPFEARRTELTAQWLRSHTTAPSQYGTVTIKQLSATHYFHTALDVSDCVDLGCHSRGCTAASKVPTRSAAARDHTRCASSRNASRGNRTAPLRAR